MYLEEVLYTPINVYRKEVVPSFEMLLTLLGNSQVLESGGAISYFLK